MEQQVTPDSVSNPLSEIENARPEVVYLSANWMVLVGSLILAWISLVPVIWIGCLLAKRMPAVDAAILIGAGLSAFGWNLFHLRKLLFELYQEGRPPADLARSGRKTAWLMGSQLLLALACTHLSGPFNPIGMQQWFWMPVSAFAGMLLTRRLHMILVLLSTLLISAAYQYAAHGSAPAMYWVFGQISTSVFIMCCSFAMTQASRQRLKTARMADELRTLNARLELQTDQASVLAVAQERNRLAREIHDALGHSLTVIGVQLDAAQMFLKQSPNRALDAIQKAQRASQEGLADIRRSVSTIRINPPEQRTLVESLTSLITGAERPGLKLSLHQTGRSRPLPTLVEISLYRCAQEGITNACRHAGASEISLHLDYTLDMSVCLSVSDNGRGFNELQEKGHGLKGLRERAVLLNGEFAVGNGPQGGGYCQIVIPV